MSIRGNSGFIDVDKRFGSSTGDTKGIIAREQHFLERTQGRFAGELLPPTPTVWYDANSSYITTQGSPVRVDQWDDRSGNGINATDDNTVYVPNLEVRGQAYTPIYDNLTGGTTFIPDWDNSNVQILTLSGNTNVSGGTSTMKGGSAYTMLVKQSNGGSHTITWDPTTYKWEEGNPPTLSTADGSVDIITFICDGTSLYGLIAKNFQ